MKIKGVEGEEAFPGKVFPFMRRDRASENLMGGERRRREGERRQDVASYAGIKSKCIWEEKRTKMPVKQR